MICTCGLFAVEFTPFYTSARFEANMNSYERAASGAGLDVFYSLTPELKVGAGGMFSCDFTEFNCLELLSYAGYMVKLGEKVRFLPEISIGYEQIWNDGDVHQTVSSGADIKLMFDIAKVSNADFVFIPYAGAGFPYLWRGGASLGIRF